MKPQKPGAAFRAQVEIANTTIRDWDRAWDVTSRTHKSLYDAMMANAPAFVNTRETAKTPPVRAEFNEFVRALQKNGMDYDRAVAFANGRPEFKHLAPSNNFANAGTAGGSSDGMTGAYQPAPGQGPTPQMPASTNPNGIASDDYVDYQIPYDCTQEEMAAAKSAGTLDSKAVFGAMVKHVAKTKNMTPDAATAYAMGQYRVLARNARISPPTMRSTQGQNISA